MKRWSVDEDYTLEENLAVLSPRALRRLFPDRSVRAVEARMARLGLNGQRMDRQGLAFTVPETALILGVAARQVLRWIEKGLFVGVERCTSLRSQRSRYSIPWTSLDDFLTENGHLFSAATFPRATTKGVDFYRTLENSPSRTGWVTCDQAARLLGASVRTVRRFCANGRVDTKRIGAVWYANRADVLALKQTWKVRRGA